MGMNYKPVIVVGLKREDIPDVPLSTLNHMVYENGDLECICPVYDCHEDARIYGLSYASHDKEHTEVREIEWDQEKIDYLKAWVEKLLGKPGKVYLSLHVC